MEGSFANQLGYLYRIWQLRYFWLSLTRKELVQRYKGSFLGIGWCLLRPLAMTCIFCLVFGKLFNYPLRDYAPHLLIGMTTWQFFTEALLKGSHSFSQCIAYIRQQPVPLAIFPLTTVLGSIFHYIVGLAMALGVTLYFQGFVNPLAVLYLIPALLLLFLLGWFLATVSGVMHSHFPDTNHLLEIGLQVLFYLTPILYRPDSFGNQGGFVTLVQWNPLTSILALIRTPLIEGIPPSMHHIQVCLLLVTVVGLGAVLLLRKLERTLIFWI
jgi:lipopolysaccharide transport system permease protein